jgi:UDP-glucose 4-epimerase
MGKTLARSALVTRGFGFIGSHLVEMLPKKQDVYVHVVDNNTPNTAVG